MIVVGTMFSNKQPHSSYPWHIVLQSCTDKQSASKGNRGGPRMKVTTQITTPILRNPAGKKRPGGYLQKSGNFGIKQVDKDQIFTVG